MIFLSPKAPSGAQMLVSGAFRRQKPAYTKSATFFCNSGSLFRNIWPRQRPNIYKKGCKIFKNYIFGPMNQ